MDMETTPHQKDPKNLQLWELVSTTDVKRTKQVEYGARKFTNIDAYSQIKDATEIRWPYGKNRGLRNLELAYNTCKDKVSLKVWNAESKKMETKNELVDFTYVTLLAEFYYPAGGEVGKFPIANNIKMGDDAVKKIMTNSICKALSYIWFNADVFLGAFDDDVAKHNEKHAEKIVEAPAPAPVQEWPKQSHVSGETIERDMARMSKDKYNCYLTPAEQEIAFLEYKELKGKELVEALKVRLAPAPTNPSPTPPAAPTTPPPTTAPTATTPPTAPAVEEGEALQNQPTPPTPAAPQQEKMPREVV